MGTDTLARAGMLSVAQLDDPPAYAEKRSLGDVLACASIIRRAVAGWRSIAAVHHVFVCP